MEGGTEKNEERKEGERRKMGGKTGRCSEINNSSVSQESNETCLS